MDVDARIKSGHDGFTVSASGKGQRQFAGR